jgi:hypothetical protein
MKTVSTPWGRTTAVEQVTISQRSGERRFATIVQLLEAADGERFVRFAYTTGGIVRRGPVTLRTKDVERMQKLLERTPELREALQEGPR